MRGEGVPPWRSEISCVSCRGFVNELSRLVPQAGAMRAGTMLQPHDPPSRLRAFTSEPTAAAVVLVGEPDGVEALGSRVERLSGFGVHVVVLGAPAGDAWSPVRVPGPGRLVLVEDRGVEAMRGLLADLDREGIGSGLVVVVATSVDPALTIPELGRAVVAYVGEESADIPATVLRYGGGAATMLRLLDDQLRRHQQLRVPDIDLDPAWTVDFDDGCAAGRRAVEAELTVATGRVATRDAAEEGGPGSLPMLLAAGVYEGTGEAEHLLVGPDWAAVDLAPAPVKDRRTLDLRTGVVHRVETGPCDVPLRSLRLASVAEPGILAMRLEAAADRLSDTAVPGAAVGTGESPDRYRGVVADEGGGIGVVVRQRTATDGPVRSIERVAAVDAEATRKPSPERAAARMLRSTGDFERLLHDQREAWAERWDQVGIWVEGDADIQLALRFALFHLWGLAGHGSELAVGARGLSGPAYSGHVFWDADAFVLPALATIDPVSARAMVHYRTRRLGQARVNATRLGYFGARYPWESARDGLDVTPQWGYIGSTRIPIVSGDLEDHITADVAWAAAHEASWSGNPLEARTPAGKMLMETARYWASRCHVDDHGVAHILGVIGPDEYHERVDDNAFTNVMARWNLRTAARIAAGTVPPDEVRGWADLAERLVDGYDAATGRYEQFRGFSGLEPLLVRDIATPPVAADLLVGRDRVEAAQIIKQPDVLMLHHLVPDEVAPGSLEPNLDFYGPRTAHGSSLSPAVMASLLARAGRTDEALEHLGLALAIDLEDIGDTAGEGLHIAALAGAWTAVLRGFLGVHVRDGVLHLDPRLPETWGWVDVRFHVLGRRVRLRADGGTVELTSDGRLMASLRGGDAARVGAGQPQVWKGDV